jgi:Flp pilus assembly protein TadD
MRHVIVACLVCMVGCMGRAPLPPKAIQLNDDGAAALAAGDLTTAEARLALAVEYNPRFTEAWVNLGLVAMERGELDRAERDIRRGRELNPDLPAPHHALGLLAERRGDLDAAERCYRAALKVDPGFPSSRANLGRLLFGKGAFDEAREQFLRLTEVAPSSIEGWTGLVESLLRLKREPEADDVLTNARARFGDVADVVLLVGRQQLRRGAYEQAEATLAPLTQEGGRRRAEAWAWIGVARLGRGDAAGARDASKEAQAIDSQEPIAFYLQNALR